MEYYTVKQMAERRKVTERAIYKQIQTHKEELEGHYKKVEGKTWYDEDAAKILEDAAMNSAPSVVLTAEKQEVEQLKEKVAELEAELKHKEKIIEDAVSGMTRIIDESNENAKLASEAKLYIEQKERVQDKCDYLEAEKQSLEAENQSLKEEIKRITEENMAAADKWLAEINGIKLDFDRRAAEIEQHTQAIVKKGLIDKALMIFRKGK